MKSLNTQALIEAAIKSQNSNKMELAEKFKNFMKICIVGGTGNISSSIVDLLLK